MGDLFVLLIANKKKAAKYGKIKKNKNTVPSPEVVTPSRYITNLFIKVQAFGLFKHRLFKSGGIIQNISYNVNIYLQFYHIQGL